MADGAFRFQGAGQYFFNAQNQSRNVHQRHGSPVNVTNSRIGFHSNDTPSPNRSPGTHSPAFSMFGQNHQQNQHALLNGQSHQQYQMRMNMAKHFQHQGNQHQSHHQNQQHHDHSNHNAGFSGHQHNMSNSNLATTPHFTPSHLQSSTPMSSHSAISKPTSEHWQEQIRLAQASREATQPHYYARNAHLVSRQALASGQTGSRRDDAEERRRALMKAERHEFTALDFGGQGLKGISAGLFKYLFLDKLYFNQNKLSWLTPQIGLLRGLTVLDLSQNQLNELPPEIGMLVNLKTLLLFDNNLQTLPNELGYLYQLETLGLEGNPLNEEMRTIIGESGPIELVRTLREHAEAPAPPNERDWIVLDETPMNSSDQDRFYVLSYNILCDKAATHALYGYAPSAVIAWENRREMVLDELRARDADIMCLQEVDAESFNEFFRPSLAHNDYKGIFWQKSRHQTMAEKDAKLVDGCATFYKNSKYILLDKQLIEFGRNAINRPDMKGEHDIFNRVMTRDDIATVAFLENRATGTRQIVVNLHLFWNPAFADVKVVQVAVLLENLKRISEQYSKWPPCKDKELFKYANGDDVDDDKEPVPPAPSQRYDSGTDIPLLICGDFNSLPQSGVHDLLTRGSLASSHVDLDGRSYGDFTRNGMNHPFQLKSSYSNIGELEFTNYTPNFVGVLDYIFYSTNALQVTGLLGEIDKAYLSRIPGFPHVYHPSDHIALMAEFSVKGRKEKKVVAADFGH